MLFINATNIGLHVMTYFVQQHQQSNVTIQTLASRFQVSPTYLAKILARLVKADLIVSVTGVNGGYRLSQAAETLTFTQVITALEGQPTFQDTLDDATSYCTIADTVLQAEAQMWQALSKKRLIDLNTI
ncbi:Rrf2 family transcriptional regulator [uncultured Secundilactobacillus sp.]|uniref:RrF2 family transcriptional regulator n=1 Tax=uncultured Secundilactobacillus sp. TaxID=2813935 RepID=UPI0025940E60|nr:Rrf2 family transcriptional regulator [uncultured Secundilactobacillus sp.]